MLVRSFLRVHGPCEAPGSAFPASSSTLGAQGAPVWMGCEPDLEDGRLGHGRTTRQATGGETLRTRSKAVAVHSQCAREARWLRRRAEVGAHRMVVRRTVMGAS